MMENHDEVWFFAVLLLLLAPAALVGRAQQSAVGANTVISVDAAHPGAAISPQMFGIFLKTLILRLTAGCIPSW